MRIIFGLLIMVLLTACTQNKSRLVNPYATPETKALYRFLENNFGKKTLSGVMTIASLEVKDGEQQNEVYWLNDKTGKKPAILGLDFMDELDTWKNNPNIIEDAIYWYNLNGIPVFCWHWRDPSQQTEQFYSPAINHENHTNFDVSKITDTASLEYKAMLCDIDSISQRFKKLQNAGVPVVWRPLHEASGGWFWWGYKGAEPCKALWQLMYERMVNHHKLNNLIWVWTSDSNENAAEWYPGNNYVDIIGMDIYDPDNSHQSQINHFNAVKKLFPNKIIALSECGSIPSSANMQTDQAYWSWFMPWYGKHTKDSSVNSISNWKELFNDEYIITLDEMPNLKNYR